MKERQLCDSNGGKFDLWLCGECGIIAQKRFLPVDRKTGQHIGTVEEAARECCTPKKCELCGELVPTKKRKTYTERPSCCQKCLDGKNAERDRKRMDEAEIVEAVDYDMFYYDGPGSCYDGQYFQSPEMVDEWFMDAVHDDEAVKIEDRPKLCFVCKPIHPSQVDPTDHFERVDEESGLEDGNCTEHLNGIEELCAAIDIFNEANKDTVLGWEPDYTKIVRIDHK